MTGIEINSSSLILFSKGSDIANGEVAIDLTALGKSLRIIDDAGNVVGHAKFDAAVPKPAPSQNPDCANRGEESGESDCATCKGSVKIKLFACTVHGTCHRSPRVVAGVKSCIGCADVIITGKE